MTYPEGILEQKIRRRQEYGPQGVRINKQILSRTMDGAQSWVIIGGHHEFGFGYVDEIKIRVCCDFKGSGNCAIFSGAELSANNIIETLPFLAIIGWGKGCPEICDFLRAQ